MAPANENATQNEIAWQEEGKLIETEIAEKKSQADKILERANDLIGEIGPSNIDMFEVGHNKLDTGEISEDQFINSLPEDEKMRELGKTYIAYLTNVRETDNLQEAHKPFVSERLKQLAENLASRINYDAFLDYYDFDPYRDTKKEAEWDFGHISNALMSLAPLREIEHLAKTEGWDSEHYERLQNMHNNLLNTQLDLQKRGVLGEPLQATQELTADETKGKMAMLLENYKKGIDLIEEFSHMKRRYRDTTHDYRPKDLTALERAVNTLDTTGSDYTNTIWRLHGYDPRYVEALQRFVAKKATSYMQDGILPLDGKTYSENLTTMRSMEAADNLSNIQIEGLVESTGKVQLISEVDICDKLKFYVPPVFLRKIESITIKDYPEPEDTPENTDGWKTSGQEIPKFDTNGELISCNIEIYLKPSVDEGAELETRAIKEVLFNWVLAHEVAHRIHHELDYYDILAWETVMKEDTTAVSDYVEKARETSISNGAREDFCESFAIAVEAPSNLFVNSPKRFDYMIGLITKYMDDEQDKNFRKEIQGKLETFFEIYKRYSVLFETATGKDELNEVK